MSQWSKPLLGGAEEIRRARAGLPPERSRIVGPSGLAVALAKYRAERRRYDIDRALNRLAGRRERETR